MNNLETFNLITARVFATCYTNFPIQCDFTPDEFFEKHPDKNQVKLFCCTMQWLKRYGWITIDASELGPNSSQVQLTEKALFALNWMPETLEHDSPLGQRFMQAIAEKASASAIGALVGEAVKAFFFAGAQVVH